MPLSNDPQPGPNSDKASAAPAVAEAPLRKWVTSALIFLIATTVAVTLGLIVGVSAAVVTAIIAACALFGVQFVSSSQFAHVQIPVKVNWVLLVALVAVVAAAASVLTYRATRPTPDPFFAAVNPYAGGSCSQYLVDEPVADLGTPPQDQSAFVSWLRDHNATQAANYGRYFSSKVMITLTGKTLVPVMISNITIEPTHRSDKPAQAGSLLNGQCGSSGQGRFLETDLDVESPKIIRSNVNPNAEWLSGDTNLTPIKFPYAVSSTDAEVFYVVARTTNQAAYRLRIEWSYQDKSASTVIDNAGKAFEVAAIADTVPRIPLYPGYPIGAPPQ